MEVGDGGGLWWVKYLVCIKAIAPDHSCSAGDSTFPESDVVKKTCLATSQPISSSELLKTSTLVKIATQRLKSAACRDSGTFTAHANLAAHPVSLSISVTLSHIYSRMRVSTCSLACSRTEARPKRLEQLALLTSYFCMQTLMN